MPTASVLSGDFWTQFVLVVIFGAALVAVGVACGLAYARFQRPPVPDETFVRELAAHHTLATRMAVLACQYSQDHAVRLLALDVAVEQSERLGRLSHWLTTPLDDVRDTERTRSLRANRTTAHRFDILFLDWLLDNRIEGVEIAESGMDGPGAAVAKEVAVSHTNQADLIDDMLAERRARIQRFANRPQWLGRG
jgi:Domain of unknown function (DUF305)